MYSRLRGFVNRHRKKLLVGGIVIGGVIFLTQYTQKKIREWQEKEIRDLMERTRRRQCFESIEKASNHMIKTLALSLRESIAKILDTEAIVERLRSKTDDKVTLWNKLKILAITRSAVIIYSYSVLVTLIKLQFFLISGHLYKDSLSNDAVVKDNDTLQTKYMSLCNYFVCDGVQKLCSLIQKKVEEITVSISLKNELTLHDLEQIYWAVVSSVTADKLNDPCRNLAYYALPVDHVKDNENTTMLKLIDETLDLLESEEVRNLIQSNVRSGFGLLIDHISEYFVKSSGAQTIKNIQNGVAIPGSSKHTDPPWTNMAEERANRLAADGFIPINKITMPMAKLIPIINGQVPRKPTSSDVPSEWLQRLIMNEELRTLGANVYEAFSF